MRILLERSGGFAGIKKKAEVDSEALSKEDSAELERLVEAAGILNQPAAPAGPPQGADQFQYNLTIGPVPGESEEASRTVTLRDPSNEAVKRLLDWMWARKQ
jgi:hypothetical protein